MSKFEKKGKKYEILGVPSKLADRWLNDKDNKRVRVFKHSEIDNYFRGEVYLTAFEKFMVKRKLKKYNKEHDGIVTLRRVKHGRRCK